MVWMLNVGMFDFNLFGLIKTEVVILGERSKMVRINKSACGFEEIGEWHSGAFHLDVSDTV